MLRYRIARLVSVSPATAYTPLRSYATPPPPPSGQSAPNAKANKSGSNTLLYSVLGVAVAAGTYYYYANPYDVNAAKEKARRDQEEMEKRARETLEAGKARADDAYKQGQAKYDAVKAEGKEKVHELEDRARQVATDTQDKFDSYKKSAQRSVSDARNSTEDLYKEARSTAERQVGEVRSGVERKAEEARSGWFSWLGWGKSKTDEAKQDVAGKVAESAEDVRKRAEKHT
ncbi:hypothetical protein H0H87_004180 [Tephrocybe sp. NHM501043]|nr:hypothetical protein H0H87_004180 [Tephrocybe sp. NHM501043]